MSVQINEVLNLIPFVEKFRGEFSDCSDDREEGLIGGLGPFAVAI